MRRRGDTEASPEDNAGFYRRERRARGEKRKTMTGEFISRLFKPETAEYEISFDWLLAFFIY
jgi:hypothetical protein